MNPNKRKLFSVENPKAAKSVKYGWLNAIHYMAPFNIAGVGNLCPWASDGCKAACLGYHSGQASMVADSANTDNKNSVRQSRDDKAVSFMKDRQNYLAALSKQINKAAKEAEREGLRLCVRLNGSTDIDWAGIRMSDGQSLIAKHADCQFTEYTKSVKRALAHARGELPVNLYITFSRSETNEAQCLDVLKAGGNVAVVFRKALPETWNGYRVIDGDKHDLRHLDPKGVVVGLVAKGSARKDQSGFVVAA